jgi:hypothetical protein
MLTAQRRPIRAPLFFTGPLALCVALAASGCGDGSGPASKKSKNSKVSAKGDHAAKAGSDDGTDMSSKLDAAETKKGFDALVAWLDPAASAASFSRGDRELDSHVVSTIYALPPRAAELLEYQQQVDMGLAGTLGSDAAEGLLGTESLLFRPAISMGHYVLRPIAVDRAKFESTLEEAGMIVSEAEGFKIYTPTGAFPWKIVVLEDGVAGFIPMAEVGSGLSPFTAGRDLPPSELEQEITKFLHEDPGVFLTLHASGPMLHYDVDAKIAMTQFALRDDGKNIIGQVVLQPMGDIDETANALESRQHPEENKQVQMLISNVAFIRDAQVVVGKLELTPEQIDQIKR